MYTIPIFRIVIYNSCAYRASNISKELRNFLVYHELGKSDLFVGLFCEFIRKNRTK